VSQAYRNPEHWTTMSIWNTAHMGQFSSDRAIREYCQEIWRVGAVKVPVAAYDPATAAMTR
jgi:starch phosphorylase